MFCSLVCEWLLCLTVFETYWRGQSLTFQLVSGCHRLLCFKPTDNDCPWLFSLWVAAVPWYVSNLVTIPVLGSSASEWLSCLSVFQACWQCLFLALQPVSDSCALLYFKPADNSCPWLSSKWVAAVPWCVSSLMTMPVLGSPACEQQLCLGVFQACWQYLSLVLQLVSGSCALLCLKLINNACPWLFRKWVAAVHCYLSSSLTMHVLGSPACEWLVCLPVFQALWQCLFLALQLVSGYCALLCFKPGDNACSWLSRKWVAAVPSYVSSLMTVLVLVSPVSEWLLCLAVFISLVTMTNLGFPVCE